MSNDNIIDLASEKQAREPHLSGKARCQACKHEWVAVTAVEALAHGALECPACGADRGVFVCAPLHAKDNGTIWACACGNDTFHYGMVTGMYCSYCGKPATPD